MPRKRQSVAAQAAARGPLTELPAGRLDELIKGPMTPDQVQDLMLALNKAVIERIMGAEMSAHLGYAPGAPKPEGQANERNGASGRTVFTDPSVGRVEVPRGRNGSFEPILIPKHERRIRGFDERVIAMYATDGQASPFRHGAQRRNRVARTAEYVLRCACGGVSLTLTSE